jgi:hypothetical protein
MTLSVSAYPFADEPADECANENGRFSPVSIGLSKLIEIVETRALG